MKKINYLDLDGQILRTFLVVLEENSVSRAADQLGVTQSAVSHTLAKLRRILGNPLFVRSGQGLTPTETALSLKEPVQDLVNGMKALTDQRAFDPKAEDMQFTIAANDLQRELIFPTLIRETRSEGIRLELEFMPSGVPAVSMLREAQCQLVLAPLLPDAPDIFRKLLFTGKMMCFFDGSMRQAPTNWEEYCKTEHIAVRFASGRGSRDVLRGVDHSMICEPTITVSNFNAIPSFIKKCNLISTEMDLMHLGPLKDLSMAPLPFKSDPVSLHSAWHERSNNDPAHIWFRRRIEKMANYIQFQWHYVQNGESE